MAEAGAGSAGPAGVLRDVHSAASGEVLRPYETTLGADELLKRFFAEVSDVSRDAEVQRCVHCSTLSVSQPDSPRSVLSCFKLNPYEHLNLRFDSQPDEVKRQYRKVRRQSSARTPRLASLKSRAQISLMVHPDKCKHPRAREAFEGAFTRMI